MLVYGGAGGTFTLYEDQGTSTDYERGAFSLIQLTWDDAARALTIGARQGAWEGMPAKRTFQVVLVTDGKAVGFSTTDTPTPDSTVTYDGKAVTVRL
ncbi:DUF5110 domain-containing protein [Sorangium sp. So ce693]|uniref:DUF5110 domain-containing protein n=1 Tax=Sorangium sp. So ce693 TaxID=3133318 RepID=UPI003F5FD283